MLNRRHFGTLALLGTAATAPSVRGENLPAGTRGIDQLEYLFWLGDAERQEARRTAQSVLEELDAGPTNRQRLSGVYHRAGAAHRKRYGETASIDRLVKGRGPLGRLRERVLQGVEGGFRMLPNYPDGEYVIVVFDSMFEQLKDIQTEQVTLARVPTQNQWLFHDYYVNTKPYYKY
ncbi:DUF4019 domain-containing protein [Eleftheria terrae]|uniref:DUF4019 domain-containing protein n=1 Tax=Eleftheria terrae TaxID=1597781 RepID=UPI00263AFC48|nr:DUF4019 domain-containing protein [Eleftheria terrae]WKB56172.1 DUF4019 domain-containing protein [Eleftheria terrae]